jgi:hypothetical protein
VILTLAKNIHLHTISVSYKDMAFAESVQGISDSVYVNIIGINIDIVSTWYFTNF